jgi:proteasome lid subunit RPN8/RPN11
MIDFQCSPVKYAKDKKLYGAKNLNLVAESEFPTVFGNFAPRNFDDDYDLNLKLIRKDNPPRDETIPSKYWLPHVGSKIAQDPVNNPDNNLPDGHKLHPVEVVIDRSVMEEIVELGRSVCPDVSSGDVFEVMGFLAGRINKDKSGRVWSHVTKSFHSPTVAGEPDHVVLPAEQSGRWLTEIREAGLTYLGLWHTHPTYTPFQSDARLWSWLDGDMDVQTLKKRCHAWYHCSLVVDPYAGRGNVENDNMVMSGCYKAVNPGIPISNSDLDSGLEMGWRSVTHMIKR